MSQRDGHRLKSQITEGTAQHLSAQRALASKGEVYVTLTQTETDRDRQRQTETDRDRQRQTECQMQVCFMAHDGELEPNAYAFGV